jgi:hypothetical protein
MSGKNPGWKSDFVENCCFRIDEDLRMIKKSFDCLSDIDIWKQPNKASNSMGNLILHLRGNITQYIISSLGGLADTRERELEFSANPGYSRERLLELLGETANRAKETIKKCETDSFLRVHRVQGFELSGIGMVIHVVEHLSYHTGQIALLTKLITDRDLGFYEGTDLNIKNA